MRNFGFFSVLLICIVSFNQCKNKSTESSDEDHDYHCYKYYNFNFSDITRPENSLTGILKADGVEYAFIIGSELDKEIMSNQTNPDYQYKVYKFQKGNNKFQNCEQLFPNDITVLFSINSLIENNTDNQSCPKKVELKGDFGCNPKLLYKDDAIFHFEIPGDTNHKHLPLPTVVHEDLDRNHIAEILTSYCFKMANADFDKLVAVTKNNKNYELALDKTSSEKIKKLRVVDPENNSNYLFEAIEKE